MGEPAVICITGGEQTVAALEARLAAHAAYPLQEVRLDQLAKLDDHGFDLIRRYDPLVVTLRGEAEGGGFSGTPSEQFDLLCRALEAEPAYLDVELSLPANYRDALYEKRGATRLVVSHHCFHGPPWPDAPLAALNAVKADLLKVAVQVEDAADLDKLLALGRQDDRPMVRIGMGEAGLLSRVLYERFGSPWTYVLADGAPQVAPGQVTASTARAWRLGEGLDFQPIGLVGGSQVMHSPGPEVYNRLFSERGLPFVYVPVVTHEAASFLDLCKPLHFAGLSVTMPAKEILFQHTDQVEPPWDKLGAINTLIFSRDGQCRGGNSDAPALAKLLGEDRKKEALVLGAGGVARAALSVLEGKVKVAGRTGARAESLARSFDADWIPWEQRHTVPFEVVINATPCGAEGVDDPLPRSVVLKKKTVLDVIIARHKTPLLARAEREGARIITGLDMWFEQGALQMTRITGQEITAQELREAYHG